MYFPDPMFYPGFYPTGNNPYGQQNMMPQQMGGGGFNPMMQQQQPYYDMGGYQKQRRSPINNNYEKNRLNNLPQQNRNPNKFSALQDYVNTIHRIHNSGGRKYNN